MLFRVVYSPDKQQKAYTLKYEQSTVLKNSQENLDH